MLAIESISSSVYAIGQSLFGLAGLGAGWYCVQRAREATGFGIHLVIAAAICIGGVGILLSPVAAAIGQNTLGLSVAMAGDSLMRVGMALLCVFLWRVFRQSSVGGAGGVILCSAGLVASLVWDHASQSNWILYDRSSSSAHATQLAIAIPMIWAAGETLVYRRGLIRRAKLGLGDPMTCHRFLLWTAVTLMFVGLTVGAVLSGWAAGEGYATLHSATTLVRGLMYFVISGAIFVGLFTPAAYRRWVEARFSATT